MLDMKLIREEPERIREAMVKRHLNPAPVEKIILLDEQRRQLIQDVEEMRAERNTVSKEISRTKKDDERQAKIEAMRVLGEKLALIENDLQTVESDLNELMPYPNIPDRTPVGVDDAIILSFGLWVNSHNLTLNPNRTGIWALIWVL